MGKNDKDKLNQAFDDIKLSVKWPLEDLIDALPEYKAIFKDDKAYEDTKAFLTDMLEKFKKL